MSNEITITFSSYLDENGSVMDRAELNKRIAGLKKERDKLQSWVKHHQKSVENCFAEKNSLTKERDELKELVDRLSEVCEFYGDECFVPRTKDASDWCCASDLELIKQENKLHYNWGGKRAREATNSEIYKRYKEKK